MIKSTINDIYRIIKKYDIITIYGHINPDYDCYGSSLALREIIKDNFPNKKVFAIGNGQELLYERLTKYDDVSDEIIQSSLAIICDASDVSRISDERITKAKNIIKIDHHIESKPFIGVKYVDVGAVSCAQMIAEFALAKHLYISKLAAELLYVGIATDSGRFRYSPTNKRTHEIVAKLYDLDIETDSIYQLLYQCDEKIVKYQALLVSNFKKTENGVVYCFADVQDYEKFGLTYDEISKNVNVIGNIIGSKIWCLFTRSKEGQIRIEFRSNNIDIQQIAVKYGGGGHIHAAGARLENQKDFTLAKQIVDDLNEIAGK